jgi:phage-related holin
MFNQVFSFAFGLVRMVSMILIALAIAWFITNVMVRLRGNKKPSKTIQTAATAQSGELAAKKAESSDNESN